MKKRIRILTVFILIALCSAVVKAEEIANIKLEHDNDENIISVFIPSNITEIEAINDPTGKIEKIVVDSENTHFCSVDGVLYSKDMKILYCYPAGKKEKKFIVPNSVETIEDSAFFHSKLVEITLPDTIKK